MQKALCELLWSCNSQQDVAELIKAMPQQYRQEADSMLALLAATAFDELDDVSDYVKELIRNCS